MKSRLSFLALAFTSSLLIAGCSDDNPTAPAGPTTVTETFTATLTQANEVPGVTNEGGAAGTVTVTLHESKDAQLNLTAATTDFQVTLTGFNAGTTITAAHIHPGSAGVNGSALVNLGLTAGEVALTNGAGSITKTGIAFDLAQANAFIANPSTFYFNVHTALNGGGAIRGQLARR
jgi:hypothetical protein